MVDAPHLSIVVPVYNEEESLPILHEEIRAALRELEGGFEILFVDDGSRDGSLEMLHKLAAEDPCVRIVALEGNHGQSAALAAGFERVRGAITVTLDADLQNDPADIPRLLTHLERADVVNGIRVGRCDSAMRRLSSRIGNGFRNWVTGESVTDVGCSLRAMRSKYLKRLRLYRGMHRFLPTLLRLDGARVVEVPVAHRPRRHGQSSYGIGNRVLVGFVDVFAVRWMQSRVHRFRSREVDHSPDRE